MDRYAYYYHIGTPLAAVSPEWAKIAYRYFDILHMIRKSVVPVISVGCTGN